MEGVNHERKRRRQTGGVRTGKQGEKVGRKGGEKICREK